MSWEILEVGKLVWDGLGEFYDKNMGFLKVLKRSEGWSGRAWPRSIRERLPESEPGGGAGEGFIRILYTISKTINPNTDVYIL